MLTLFYQKKIHVDFCADTSDSRLPEKEGAETKTRQVKMKVEGVCFGSTLPHFGRAN